MPPSIRSSAEAIQIVLLHTLGDAFSPFILGAVSESLIISFFQLSFNASKHIKSRLCFKQINSRQNHS